MPVGRFRVLARRVPDGVAVSDELRAARVSRRGGLKYDVNTTVTDSAYKYLEGELAEKPPTNESWWPAYTAWESFAVKVLVEGGRNQDSNINRLYGYLDRMPVFALAYLHDAMAANGETGARLAELRRRMANAVLPEAGSVHVEELSDPYLLWFWNSNIRSTSVVLDTLVHASDASDAAPEITGMVRWLMAARKNGRWGNTQENAVRDAGARRLLPASTRPVPNFTALVKLGTRISCARRSRAARRRRRRRTCRWRSSRRRSGWIAPI